MEKGYQSVIKFSSKELTAKERVAIKDTTNAVSLATACETAPLVITPAFWVELEVHNEHSKESKDYTHYVVVDTSGNRYFTGSPSFWSSFCDIMAEMEGSDEEFAIEVTQMASKNRAGKNFLTCSIV